MIIIAHAERVDADLEIVTAGHDRSTAFRFVEAAVVSDVEDQRKPPACMETKTLNPFQRNLY